MGQVWSDISEENAAFINAQKLFFVATAPHDGRVNVSPKGLNSFKIIDNHTVAYLDMSGSGNETAAHVLENGRITFMFAAFEGPPKILRLYGDAEVIRPFHASWDGLAARFEMLDGARQFFVAKIDRVATSCGFGIPIYEFQEERTRLTEWVHDMGPERLEDFCLTHNTESIDHLPTGYLNDEF